MIQRAVDSVERFHRAAWISRVRGATGLDVSALTHPGDVADPVAATTAWSQALADDVHGQIRNRMMAGLLVGGLLQSDAKALAGDVIAKARGGGGGLARIRRSSCRGAWIGTGPALPVLRNGSGATSTRSRILGRSIRAGMGRFSVRPILRLMRLGSFLLPLLGRTQISLMLRRKAWFPARALSHA
jgi:hypothetical protein